MIGKFKRNVLKVGQGEGKTVDNLFETAKNKWEEFVLQIDNVKLRVDGLVKHSIGLCETAEQVIDTISGSFPEGSNFLNLEATNVAHKTLATKEKEEIDGLASSLNSKISELRSIFSTLRAAVAEREDLRSQMDYYKTKVAELHVERDKLKNKGGEQQKQMDRRLRNEANLNRLTHQYELKNKELKHELYTLEAVRLNVLAFLYLDILHLDHLLARGLINATNPSEVEHAPLPSQLQQSDQYPPQSTQQNLMPFQDNQQHEVSSVATSSTSTVPPSSSFDTDPQLPTSFSFDQEQSNGSTPEKKRPPPFIRSRVASTVSSPSTASSSASFSSSSLSSAPTSQDSISVPPRKNSNGILGIKLPFLQKDQPSSSSSNISELPGSQELTDTNRKHSQETLQPSNDIPPPMPKSLPPMPKSFPPMPKSFPPTLTGSSINESF